MNERKKEAFPQQCPLDERGREVLLQVRELDVTFGKGNSKVCAVRKASFDIFKGETFSLVGESGSGKSTIGKAIIRAIPCSGGEIRYKGVPISGKVGRNMERQIIRNIQMVFQDPYSSLNPAKKVGWILEEPLRLQTKLTKEERKQVKEIIRKAKKNDGVINLIDTFQEFKESVLSFSQ